VLPDKKFCGACGAALTPGLTEPSASPQSYTPKHLAEKILTSRSALEGERKQVTVLFCDVVDSSRLAGHLGAEGMHEVMDRALRLMAAGVHRYEGTINQFLGDGVMALFGAPVALEDHALRAVQAALTIRETLAGYSEQLKAERGVEIRLRLGLNTGLVVVGRIGDDLRMDYTAVGDTTHLAARMQALAEPGTILIPEAAHRLVEGFVRSEPLGPVEVKGRSEPVSVYRVTGRRRGRTRLEVSAERGLTPLVGRERELALPQDCLTRARAGRGQVVGIVGEPGVGKSRLLYEFRRSLEGERVTWLEGHCVAYGQATPYLPLIEILRANFQIEEEDNPLQLQEKLRQGLRQLDLNLDATLPFLGDLFGLPSAGEHLKYLDPKDKRQKTFETIRALTVAGSQRQPLVVIVEDLHWIDRTSEDYLAFLIESLPAMPVLLLTTHRPGYTVRWADKTYYTQIALGLLTEGETQTMLARLLESPELPRELLQIVREKAEGNPLFIEEVTTSLLERGLVVRSTGGLRGTRDAEVEIPGTIQDIIRARIDRLEEPVKRTVQTAAVIGREFGLRLLTCVSEMAEEVEGYLDTLKHLELIHEKRFFPELEYIFKHAVTQDVAYQSLLAHRRRELHGAIGRAIEDLYADRLEEQAAILAYHYARSARQDKAIEYALLAGDGAARLYANAEARTYYQQALTIAQGLPPSREAEHFRIDATLKLAGVALTREHFEQDLANLDQALAFAEKLDDRARLSKVLYWLGRIHYTVGRHAVGIDYAQRGLELAEIVGDPTLEAPPVNLLGRAHLMRGEFELGSTLLERSVRQMHAIGNRIETAAASGLLALCRGHLGQFAGALEAADHGVRIAEEINHLPTLAACLQYRAQVRSFRGDWGAFEDSRRALDLAERIGDMFRIYLVHANRGWAHYLAGDYRAAADDVSRAVTLAGQLGTRFGLSLYKSLLAFVRLNLGDPVEALRLGREALEMATESGVSWDQSMASRAVAEALLAQTRPDLQQAEDAMRNALQIQEQLGMKWELAQSRLVYGRLLRAKGDTDASRETLTQALRLFEEMGVSWGIERAEQALREP
jgi:class 3 adenylate cyclase/tetratricopeptide (TPR) repeat protein